MFRLDFGRTRGYCDGFSRRSFLQLGVAGLASVGLPQLLRAREQSSEKKDTSVILIWLDGGPGHMDMYDMKPDAPAEYRGIWKPIRTRVPGFDVTELYPKQAKIAHKFSMVRSLQVKSGDHFTGGHYMQTAKSMGVSGADNHQKFPGLGAIVNREVGPRTKGMPASVAVPYNMTIGIRPGYLGPHFLGPQHNVFESLGDANQPNYRVPNLNLAGGLDVRRLEDRRSLSRHFDTVRREIDTLPDSRAMDRFSHAAYEMVTGPAARRAFDVGKEDTRTRDKYGRTHWGQSTLLARRLVEAGSTFVTVHLGGWDHHWDLQKGYENYLPQVDTLVSALFEDLDDRGLLSKTLVMLCGEFSRTPKMNDGGNGGAPRSMGTPGRDHWGDSMFCLMGGGGLKSGVVVGATDRLGQRPTTTPYLPCHVHATMYQVLGIDPKLELRDPSGRPVPVLDDPTPIKELV